MIAALRRFFRRFQPRVLRITVIDSTGATLLDVSETACAMLASLQGHPGMLVNDFASTRPLRLVITVVS